MSILHSVLRRCLAVPDAFDRAGGKCDWHCAAGLADGSVSELGHVVGPYNHVPTTERLHSLFTALEFTLFRQDMSSLDALQSAIEDRFEASQVIVLHGKSTKNRYIHLSCVACGTFVYVPFDNAQLSGRSEADRLRRRLYTFFLIEQRSVGSGLLPEV